MHTVKAKSKKSHTLQHVPSIGTELVTMTSQLRIFSFPCGFNNINFYVINASTSNRVNKPIMVIS